MHGRPRGEIYVLHATIVTCDNRGGMLQLIESVTRLLAASYYSRGCPEKERVFLNN